MNTCDGFRSSHTSVRHWRLRWKSVLVWFRRLFCFEACNQFSASLGSITLRDWLYIQELGHEFEHLDTIEGRGHARRCNPYHIDCP